MKNKRIFGIGVLVISICLPSVVFKAYDYYVFHKEVQWKDASIEHEIKEKHPIIQEIYYKYFDDTYVDDRDTFSIKRQDEYTKEKRDKFSKIQSLFEKEINRMIQNDVLSYKYFEMEESSQFKLPFGTIGDDCLEDGKYDLDMTFRIPVDNCMMFIYNKKTSLITDFFISNRYINNLKEKDIRKMLHGYLTYLNLDDIEDWKWTQYGYESSLAKLQLYYRQDINEDGIGQLSIYFQPYGTYVPFKDIVTY